MARGKPTSTFEKRPNRSVEFGRYSLGDCASIIVDSANPFEALEKDPLTPIATVLLDNGQYETPRYELEVEFDAGDDLSKVNVGEMLELITTDFENTGFAPITDISKVSGKKLLIEGREDQVDNTYASGEAYSRTFPLYGGFSIECETDDPSVTIKDEEGERIIPMFAGQVKQANEITKLEAPNGRLKLYLL